MTTQDPENGSGPGCETRASHRDPNPHTPYEEGTTVTNDTTGQATESNYRVKQLHWWDSHGLMLEKKAHVRAWQVRTGRETLEDSTYAAFPWECLFAEHARCFGLRSLTIRTAFAVQDKHVDRMTCCTEAELAFHLTEMLDAPSPTARQIWEEMTSAGWWAGPYSEADGIRLAVPVICPTHGLLL